MYEVHHVVQSTNQVFANAIEKSTAFQSTYIMCSFVRKRPCPATSKRMFRNKEKPIEHPYACVPTAICCVGADQKEPAPHRTKTWKDANRQAYTQLQEIRWSQKQQKAPVVLFHRQPGMSTAQQKARKKNGTLNDRVVLAAKNRTST